MADPAEFATAPVVVVAEDQALLRMTVIETLTDEGFLVIEASHAAEALAALHLQADDVHALFTDIAMPGAMDGLTLAHQTQAKWPWIVLLITSGSALPRGAALPAGSRFLPKPYEPSHVVIHLRELLTA